MSVVITILIGVALQGVFLLIPSWKIYKRAGLNPWLSLTILIPILGFFIAAAILAYSNWNVVTVEEGY